MGSKFFSGQAPADVGNDTSFFISGSKGGKYGQGGNIVGGVSVFGGDLVVSGGIYHQHDPTSAGRGMTGGYGDIIILGNTTTSQGKLYYFHTDGTWVETDASSVLNAKGMYQLLGIALGANSGGAGMLVRGFVNITVTGQGGTDEGLPVYVDDSGTGLIGISAPAGSGDFVRLVGWVVDDTGTIYFNPSNDWIELS